MSTKPPKGTKHETRNVLKNVIGGTETAFEWNMGRKREGWFTPGTVWGTSPEGMASAGWRYARVAEDSDNG